MSSKTINQFGPTPALSRDSLLVTSEEGEDLSYKTTIQQFGASIDEVRVTSIGKKSSISYIQWAPGGNIANFFRMEDFNYLKIGSQIANPPYIPTILSLDAATPSNQYRINTQSLYYSYTYDLFNPMVTMIHQDDAIYSQPLLKHRMIEDYKTFDNSQVVYDINGYLKIEGHDLYVARPQYYWNQHSPLPLIERSDILIEGSLICKEIVIGSGPAFTSANTDIAAGKSLFISELGPLSPTLPVNLGAVGRLFLGVNQLETLGIKVSSGDLNFLAIKAVEFTSYNTTISGDLLASEVELGENIYLNAAGSIAQSPVIKANNYVSGGISGQLGPGDTLYEFKETSLKPYLSAPATVKRQVFEGRSSTSDGAEYLKNVSTPLWQNATPLRHLTSAGSRGGFDHTPLLYWPSFPTADMRGAGVELKWPGSYLVSLYTQLYTGSPSKQGAIKKGYVGIGIVVCDADQRFLYQTCLSRYNIIKDIQQFFTMSSTGVVYVPRVDGTHPDAPVYLVPYAVNQTGNSSIWFNYRGMSIVNVG